MLWPYLFHPLIGRPAGPLSGPHYLIVLSATGLSPRSLTDSLLAG